MPHLLRTCCWVLSTAVMKILALKTTAIYSKSTFLKEMHTDAAFSSNTEADKGERNETVRSSQRVCCQVPGLMGSYVLSTGEELPVERTSVNTAVQVSNLAVTKRCPASVW